MNEHTRHWMYIGAVVLIAVLIVIDVLQGGSAADWVKWIGYAVGIGGASLAAANTSATPKIDLDSRLNNGSGGGDE